MGDFNARIGIKGSIYWYGEGEERKSKNRGINTQGEELLRMTEENGLGIRNGNTESNGKGEWTFINNIGSSVIDYTIVSAETWEKIESFKIGERTESDHLPMETRIKENYNRIEEEEEKETEVEDWTEKGIKEYRERLEGIGFEKEEVQEELRELIEKMKEAVKKKKIKKLWNEK